MADPDQTLPPADDEPEKPLGPSGTLVGDELSDAEPPPVVTRPMPALNAQPEPSQPMLGAVTAEPTRRIASFTDVPAVQPPSPSGRGGALLAFGLVVSLLLAAVGGWVIVNADEPLPAERAVVPPTAPAPVPAPRPAPAKTPERRAERAPELVLPSKPPPPGSVKVLTTPETRVLVDGQDFGEQPVTLTLPAGRNTLVLENAELNLKRVVTIDVKPNTQTEETFTFAKGWLRVAAPRDARVSLDGQRMTQREVEVWEGNHRVDIVHADRTGSHDTQVAVVTAGKITGVFFQPPRATASRR